MLMNASFLASESDVNCEPNLSTSSTYPDEGNNSSEQIECKVMVWGLNDKEQLAGLKGSKVKCPTFSSTLSQLRPIHIAGGSKSLFIVSKDGKVGMFCTPNERNIYSLIVFHRFTLAAKEPMDDLV